MADLELSPRQLAEHLGASWRLDQPFVGRFRLFDMYAHDQRDSVCVELRDGARALVVEVQPDAGRGTRVAGLSLAWAQPGPAEAGEAACRLLAKVLSESLGSSPRRYRWGAKQLPADLEAEVQVEPASLAGDPDEPVLTQDGTSYLKLYGVQPRVRQVSGGGQAAPGVSVWYPEPVTDRLPASGAVYEAPRRVSGRRLLRRYFARLGCVFDDAGYPRTVPTPATLARALETLSGRARIRARMVPHGGLSVGRRFWVGQLTQHVLPITVAPRWAVAGYARARWALPRDAVPIDVGMIVHDISLHALAFHAISERAWDRLVRLARARLDAEGPQAADAVGDFFESPLTQTCWDTWKQLDHPDEFAGAFDQQLDALAAQLTGA